MKLLLFHMCIGCINCRLCSLLPEVEEKTPALHNCLIMLYFVEKLKISWFSHDLKLLSVFVYVGVCVHVYVDVWEAWKFINYHTSTL